MKSINSIIFIITLLFITSCNNKPKTNETLESIKSVCISDSSGFSDYNINEMINKSLIRKGGYVVILPTSLKLNDKDALALRDNFYSQKVEAVHILNFDLNSIIKNTDILTIENARILCVLNGNTEDFMTFANKSKIKSAIIKAHEKGALISASGNAVEIFGRGHINIKTVSFSDKK